MSDEQHISTWGAVIVAIFGFFTAIAGAWKAHVMSERAKEKTSLLEQAEKEIEMQRGATSFAAFLSSWGEINAAVLELIRTTEVDRFMLLQAWNGYLHPRWTTAVYQIRETDQEPIAYVHLELDEYYVSRLRELVTVDRPLIFQTANMPECAIQRIYNVEGVNEALWAHLQSETMDNGRSVAVTYCSFATHADSLSPNTKLKCELLANRLKAIAQAYTPRPVRV